jgi:L-asparaginase
VTSATAGPKAERPRVAVVFTGGTISMTVDREAGGARPVLDGAALLAMAPGIEAVADIVAVDLGRTPASHFTFDRLLEVAAVARGVLAADTTLAGAVIVQGTDTIDEAAFVYDLVHADVRPVVVTGAMRSADAPGADGPANLRDAVIAAGDPALRGEGVVVVMSGEVHAADSVVKLHASAVDAFGSPDTGPLGRVEDGRLRLLRRRAGRRHLDVPTGPVPPVALFVVAVGLDGSEVGAAVASGARAVVVEAFGSGNTSPLILAAAERAIAAGIPVVLASRAVAGRVAPTYAFPGGGATWERAGAILAGHITGPKARAATALGLAVGLDRAGLAALLADPG